MIFDFRLLIGIGKSLVDPVSFVSLGGEEKPQKAGGESDNRADGGKRDADRREVERLVREIAWIKARLKETYDRVVTSNRIPTTVWAFSVLINARSNNRLVDLAGILLNASPA